MDKNNANLFMLSFSSMVKIYTECSNKALNCCLKVKTKSKFSPKIFRVCYIYAKEV